MTNLSIKARPKRRRLARQYFPGLMVALIVAFAANFLGTYYGAPTMLFALLLGLALNFLADDEKVRPGLDFAAKTVLRIGVALLGLRIVFADIVGMGWQPLALIVVATVSTILVGVVAAQLAGHERRFGTLTGGAVAICGASAAMALSAILPNYKNKESETAFTVVAVTTLSTAAMIVYPLVSDLFGLSDTSAGFFIGATIHDVAQVVGAGFSISDEAGKIATVAKLIRVAMLVPIVLVVAVMFRDTSDTTDGKRPPVLPFFLLVFMALAGVNSVGILPEILTAYFSDFSRLCLTTAIAAVGAKTQLGQIMKVGWKPVFLVIMETVWIAALILAAMLLLPTG